MFISGNAVIGFQKNHPFLEELLQELSQHYAPHQYAANGPLLITRVFKEFCKIDKIKEMSPDIYQNITILLPEAFYPIPWQQGKIYFTEEASAARRGVVPAFSIQSPGGLPRRASCG